LIILRFITMLKKRERGCQSVALPLLALDLNTHTHISLHAWRKGLRIADDAPSPFLPDFSRESKKHTNVKSLKGTLAAAVAREPRKSQPKCRKWFLVRCVFHAFNTLYYKSIPGRAFLNFIFHMFRFCCLSPWILQATVR